MMRAHRTDAGGRDRGWGPPTRGEGGSVQRTSGLRNSNGARMFSRDTPSAAGMGGNTARRTAASTFASKRSTPLRRRRETSRTAPSAVITKLTMTVPWFNHSASSRGNAAAPGVRARAQLPLTTDAVRIAP